jgi:peroxiredoxin
MTVLSVRGRLVRAVLALCCFGLLVQMQVCALIIVGGDGPVQDMGWPKGVVDVANLPSRYRWTEGPPFGGGEYRFEYAGDTEAFNEALERLAEIRAPKLDLVIHDGPGLNYAMNEDEQQGVDWIFTIWTPAQFYRNFKGPRSHLRAGAPGYDKPLPPPLIDVYVWEEGSIDWSKVEMPANIDVTDKRASTAGYTPDDGGVLVGSVYDMGTGQPVEGARVFLVHYRGDPKPETTLTATVDEDGVFEFKRVPKGSYRVNVEADGCAARQAAYYGNRGHTYEKVIVYLAKAGTVQGEVVGPDGQPAVGARVYVRNLIGIDGKGYSLVDEPEPRVTDEAGRFEIAGLPAGYIGLTCAGDWHSRTIFEVYDVPSDDIRLTASRTGTIRCKIVDSEGNPVDGKTMIELSPKGKNKIGRWGSSGWMPVKAGLYVFENLPADEYVIGTSHIPEEREDDPDVQSVVLKPGAVVTVKLVASEEEEEEEDEHDEPEPVRLVDEEAPDLDVAAWVNGEPVTLESFRGKVVVVAFWAADEEECAEIVPVLNGLLESEVEVVSVHRADADSGELKRYIKENGIRYRVAKDGGATFEEYNARRLPAFYVINREGVIQYQDISLDAQF